MIRRFYFGLFLSMAIATCFYSVKARAAEALIFDRALSPSSQLLLQSYSQQTLRIPLTHNDIAQIDLNGDGLNEFILRPQTCQSASTCTFRILGESSDQILDLGQIKARMLALSDNETNGVRDIIAYDSAINDYATSIYYWEPARAQYILRKETPRVMNEG